MGTLFTKPWALPKADIFQLFQSRRWRSLILYFQSVFFKSLIMKHWYVIQTKPARENDVLQLFAQGGFEGYCPKIQEKCYRGQTPYFRTASLFPSYLFLHIDFDEKNHFHLIKYTRGVNKIVSAGGIPLSISDQIVETIRNRANSDGVIEQRPVNLKTGDKVRVRKGMLKDLEGILEKPTSPDGRVKVLLQLMNYPMKATLHWTEVEKLKVA